MISVSACLFAMRVWLSALKVPVGRVIDQLYPRYSNMASSGVNFNTKHLKKGDPQPPFNGSLRVYNMRYCPYAQRTVLALNAKQIPYEVVNINLVEKPEWLTSVSAFAKVPSIEISKGVSIYESLVTVEYLDEVYPQRPLLPKDPLKKAFDKIIVEAFNPITSFLFKLIKSPETITEETIQIYNKTLDYIQNQLKERGDKFLDGNEPGYVDYMIWPWFERLLVLQKVDKRAFIDTDKFKLLVNYLDAMKKDPAVSQYLVPDEVMLEFFNAYKEGKTPPYDILLQN